MFKNDLERFNQGSFKSFQFGDFNNNGKEDFAIICVDENNNTSYLLFYEKENKKYIFVNYVPLKYFIAFISNKSARNKIYIAFQSNTDWIQSISWISGKYTLDPPDDYGP